MEIIHSKEQYSLLIEMLKDSAVRKEYVEELRIMVTSDSSGDLDWEGAHGRFLKCSMCFVSSPWLLIT